MAGCKPSRPRTQGAPIPAGIGATEDNGLRSVCSPTDAQPYLWPRTLVGHNREPGGWTPRARHARRCTRDPANVRTWARRTRRAARDQRTTRATSQCSCVPCIQPHGALTPQSPSGRPNGSTRRSQRPPAARQSYARPRPTHSRGARPDRGAARRADALAWHRTGSRARL